MREHWLERLIAMQPSNGVGNQRCHVDDLKVGRRLRGRLNAVRDIVASDALVNLDVQLAVCETVHGPAARDDPERVGNAGRKRRVRCTGNQRQRHQHELSNRHARSQAQ